MLGLDPWRKLGIPVYFNGGLDAQAFRFEDYTGSTKVSVYRTVQRFGTPDGTSIGIEKRACGQIAGVKSLVPIAVIFSRELAGVPWATIHLAKLEPKPRRDDEA